MNSSLISICIANYNKGPYIKQCLDSILSIEKYQHKEIVIIDDCSDDNSIEVIKNWIHKNGNKINVIFKINNKNSGPGYTYNQAIKNSSGDFITFMDSDDFFINSTLENKLSKFKENKNLKIIYGNGIFFENGKFNGKGLHNTIFNYFNSINKDVQKILNHIYSKMSLLSLSSALIKKDFINTIGGFDEELLSNDWILDIKIFQNLKENNEFEIDITHAFAYRIYENNISKNYDKMLLLLSQVIEKYCPKDLQNIGYSNIYFTNALSNLTIGNYKKAFDSIKKSIKFKFEVKKIILFIIGIIGSSIIKFIPKNILNKIKSIILKYFQ